MRAEFWEARCAANLRDCAERGLTAYAAAAHLNISRITVANYARKFGLVFVSGQSLTTEARAAALRNCAARGLSQKQAAEELGLHQVTVCRLANRHSIEFINGNLDQYDAPRAAQMAALYGEGLTLEQIGAQFGVSRERIRQIIKKRHGMTGVDGGKRIRGEQNKAARRERLEEECRRKNGCSRVQYKELLALVRTFIANGGTRDRSPIGAFISQRRNARCHRNIEWKLTLWEWWTIWQISGRWEERGRGHGYMMCRKGDTGPYALGNVVIATGDFNAAIQPNNPYRKGHPQFNEMMERLAIQRQARAAA